MSNKNNLQCRSSYFSGISNKLTQNTLHCRSNYNCEDLLSKIKLRNHSELLTKRTNKIRECSKSLRSIPVPIRSFCKHNAISPRLSTACILSSPFREATRRLQKQLPRGFVAQRRRPLGISWRVTNRSLRAP